MRHPAIRLITAMLCAAAFLLQPVLMPENFAVLPMGTHTTPAVDAVEFAASCSCAMCKIIDGVVHHCECCAGDICRCGISSNDQETTVILLLLESAMLPAAGSFDKPRQCSYPAAGSAVSPNSPSLSVPTPPPKA